MQALVRDFKPKAQASPDTPRPKAAASSAAAASSRGLEPLSCLFIELFFDVKPCCKFALSGLPSSFRASSSTHEDDEENDEEDNKTKKSEKGEKNDKEKKNKEKKDKKEKKKGRGEDDDDSDGAAGATVEETPMKRPSRATGSRP